MIDWERRKQSEDWARRKSIEFYKANSDLTFVEWCYQQGIEEEREKIIAILENALISAMEKIEKLKERKND